MSEDKPSTAEKIIAELIKDGWKMQNSGIIYQNDLLATNLYNNRFNAPDNSDSTGTVYETQS